MGVQLAAEQVVMPEVENVDLSDSELLYHVRDALKSAIQGDMDNYSQLVGVINRDQHLLPEEVALLVTCLKALSGAVSCIDIVHHRSLLSSILRMSMWNYGTDVMDALMELVVSLAASSGQYFELCLEMLVSNFMPPYTFLQLLSQPRGQARKGQVLDRVHSTLKHIADLVPLSPLRLEKIIKERMPNIFIKEPLIVMYVENMLKLESSPLGELVGSTMLVAIMDRLVDLDVDISWDAILQDDFTKGIFDIELEDLEGPIDDGQQESFDFELQRDMWIDRFFGDSASAQKLDSLMVLIFEYFISCNDSGRLGRVFDTLLQSFEKTVLTAYKSKFAQFVMFYACSLDPKNCGKRFANSLIHMFEAGVHLEWRMSAVAYLASYLARASFMDMPFVADCLERLVNWCSNYCKSMTGEVNPNPRAHKDFYAGCQAIMYIICFRRGSIHSLFRIKSQLLRMRIEDILRHSLSPLMVCLPSIVEEFLRVAETTRLFSFPDNNAPTGSGIFESELSIAFGGNQRLDAFFPFDPCLLKKSDRFIRPNFIYWSMVRNSYDEVEDDECTSDEDDVEVCIPGNGMDIVDGAGRSSQGDDEDDLDYNLNKMSITPRNTLAQRFGGERAGLQMPSRIRPCPESL